MTLWKNKDLLVLFEYAKERNKNEPGFLDSIVLTYKHYARWSNFLVRLVMHIFGFFVKPKAKAVKFFFWGTKFEELILSLPAEEVCVIGGPSQLIFCIKHQRKFMPCMNIWGHMWDELIIGLENEKLSHFADLKKHIDEISNQLNCCREKDAILIINNDSLPMQRLMILAAKGAGVSRSICIQHGIFQRKSPGSIMDGWFADQFFSINKQQRKILIEKGIDSEKIKVMGFHSSSYVFSRPTASPKLRKICFIGQPWMKYSAEKGLHYLEIVEKVIRLLEPHFKVYYKPHPWERKATYLANIENVTDIPMHTALEDYDVFVSLTSTALLEANMAGRIAIQIIEPFFDADDFSEYGEIIAINIFNKEFEKLLLNSVFSIPPESKLINKLAERFYSALNQ